MIRIKPDFSQVLFSLTFVYCLTFVTKSLGEFTFIYSFFLWIWLTFIARKTVKHPMTNHYGKSLTDINTMLTILTLVCDCIIVILSTSFLVRMIFISNIIEFVKYGTLAVFIFSLIGHVVVSSKNFFIIERGQNTSKTVIKLLIYPVGIWTIQETLKQK